MQLQTHWGVLLKWMRVKCTEALVKMVNVQLRIHWTNQLYTNVTRSAHTVYKIPAFHPLKKILLQLHRILYSNVIVGNVSK